MHPIPEAFFCATLAGLWPCEFWTSTKKKQYYNNYKTFNILTMCLLIVPQTIAILYKTENKHELIESLHVFFTASNACMKCANILLRREKFFKLANMFLEEECMPKNPEEKEISEHFNWLCRIMVIGICVLGELTALCFIARPLFEIGDKYTLPSRVWLPFSINRSLTFWPTYVNHAYAAHLIAAWNVSIDLLAVGFMLQICFQFRIIGHRLNRLPKVVTVTKWPGERLACQFEIQIIKQCVLHHSYVIEIIKHFKLTFVPNIVFQYCLSGVTIALTIYELAVNKTDILNLIVLTIYLISMVVELSLYCWFGNEITLHGLQINDFIYQGDWINLHPRTIKCLKTVMIRGSSPIFITYGPFVTLSNAAFMSILKVSYSAYNVLTNAH